MFRFLFILFYTFYFEIILGLQKSCKNFYFDIIIDSWEDAKEYTRKSSITLS